MESSEKHISLLPLAPMKEQVLTSLPLAPIDEEPRLAI